MSHRNVFSAEFEHDPEDPRDYTAGFARVGADGDGEELAAKLFGIPPGQSLCPYHYGGC